MFNQHGLADKAGAILFEKAERRLEALLAEHGASDPSALPLVVKGEILQRAIVETVAANFPTANIEMLRHGFGSFAHPAFLPAVRRMRLSCKDGNDAFEMTRGIYAAVMLAGLGLPVAPFDLETSRILGKPSNDIDTVLALFAPNKGAFVGYSACNAPFYLLLTDCVRTLRQRILAHPRLLEIKELFRRDGAPLPPDPGGSSRASQEIRFRPSACWIRTRWRGRSCCMPAGRSTVIRMALRMTDTSPSRGSCFARSSMTQRLPTGFGAAPPPFRALCIERLTPPRVD